MSTTRLLTMDVYHQATNDGIAIVEVRRIIGCQVAVSNAFVIVAVVVVVVVIIVIVVIVVVVIVAVVIVAVVIVVVKIVVVKRKLFIYR